MSEAGASPQQSPEETLARLIEFLRAADLDSKAAIVRADSWLLSPAAESALEGMIAETAEPSVREYLQAHIQLLRQLRGEPAAAVAAGADELREIIDELQRPAGAAQMPRRAVLCARALELVDRGTQPRLWAGLQGELANSLVQDRSGDPAAKLERAIGCYESALQVMTREALPVEWAKAQMNLGNAYRSRIRGEPAENVERAIGCYESALQVRTREALPVDWATAQMNLGNAYYSRIRGERAENVERAIGCYESALQVMTREALPGDHRDVCKNLTNLTFQERRWNIAAQASAGALAAHELLYASAATPEARFKLLEEIRGIPARFAFAVAAEGRAESLKHAAVALESGRARLLAETMELDEAPLGQATAGDRAAFEGARNEIARLQAMSRARGEGPNADYIAVSGALRAAQSELGRVADRIREYVPGFLPKADFEEIRAAAGPGAIVYLSSTAAGGMALIVRATAPVQAVPLASFTDEALLGAAKDYFAAYAGWKRSPGDKAAYAGWLRGLDDCLRWCWTTVMGPLLEHLGDVEEAVLIPGGLSSLLPLHAAFAETPGGRRYALDEKLFRYAPSARALSLAAASAVHTAPDGLLAVDEPAPVSGPRLFHSAHEVATAMSHFPEGKRRGLAGAGATHSAVSEQMPHYPVLHFSCHGFSDLANPLRGGLAMSGDHMLTLRDFLDAKLPRARLAILSACETGLPGAQLPDEVVSLPAALMQAGVDGVVGSLWSVPDISTMMLMARFYDYWKGDGMTPPYALRAAQQWVRDTSIEGKQEYYKTHLPEFSSAARMAESAADQLFKAVALSDVDFSHPFHWAAFSYVGV